MIQGLIYKVQPYQEHARLLFVYTKMGKKTLLAQGSQKINHPNRILSQYLTLIEFKESSKSFITLSESKILNDYQEIKQDFEKTRSAAFILEIIDQLIVDNYHHEFIFTEVVDALNSKNTLESSLSFSIKILKVLGYQLNLKGNGEKVRGLNIIKGGLVYEKETSSIDLELKETIIILKLAFQKYEDIEQIDENSLSKIKEFILKYYQYHLQTTLKNLK
jgi:DNA repair protein RecO (recombination protein O)